ncbi:MAG: transposase [Dehalococcoidales bacterium]|nr:transposase [Dehalococcoidales bacterium]
MLRLNNFDQEITLFAYCLMPNHFHLFIKQKSMGAIDKFMNSLGTRYTMFFNRKYKRVGSLYQGVYKAVPITNDAQFIYLSKYIHRQALALQGEALQGQPSSYEEYLDKRNTRWVHPEEVLEFFSKTNPLLSYKNFVTESIESGLLHDIDLDED